jgi:2-polyprenyl-3-methyl-5-hydroxy-6-metoxy-1,4-benzoquinol methylase
VTPLDRLLQRFRVRAASPHIPDGSRLLDVGCADGQLLHAVRRRIREGVGIDPDDRSAWEERGSPGGQRVPVRIIHGTFPDGLDDPGPFDVITMLAVFEHFTEADRPRVVEACRRLLRPGGRVVITVPAPAFDRIVDVLRTLHLVHGMDIEAHHGYDPAQTPRHFTGFRLLRHEPFELGLNHLYVLER